MLRERSIFRHCLLFIQFSLLFALKLQAESTNLGRAPANYIPDDDVIVVPLVYETHFMARLMDEKNERLYEIQFQLEQWRRQDEFLETWGLERTGMFPQQMPDERMRFFQRHFMRYVSKSKGDPLKEDIKEWWQEWRAEDEVQEIRRRSDTLERRNQANNRDQTGIEPTKTVSQGPAYKFKFKPRVFRGFMMADFESRWINAEAVLGVNKRMELKVDKLYESIGFYTMANYNFQTKFFIATANQRLTNHLSLGLTYTHDANIGQIDPTLDNEPNQNQNLRPVSLKKGDLRLALNFFMFF
jgi:hypothetical protein